MGRFLAVLVVAAAGTLTSVAATRLTSTRRAGTRTGPAWQRFLSVGSGERRLPRLGNVGAGPEPGRVPRRLVDRVGLGPGLPRPRWVLGAARAACERRGLALLRPSPRPALGPGARVGGRGGRAPRVTPSLFPFPCGHAVDANGPGGSGFDQGRDALEAAFAAGGHATTGPGGETRRASSSATATSRPRTDGHSSSLCTR